MENEEIIFIDDLEEEKNVKNEQSTKKVEQKKKKKKSLKKWVITFGIFDMIAVVCLFLMYGPFPYFRNLWVTSALTTATHEYFAYIFFDVDQVKEIMAGNVVIEGTESTDEEEIELSGKDTGVYSSIYDEQVLKRDEGNELYKVIDIEGNGYKGHILVVYDPSRIDLVQAPNIKYGGKQLKKLLEINEGIAGINASGFDYSEATGYVPNGIVIMDNEIVWGADKDPAKHGGIIGFTNDNKLILTKSNAQEALAMGIRDAVTFGPFLIVNGVRSEFKGNGGYGVAPRTAIGQRKDGIVLMLVIDGRRPGHSLGVDMVELTNVLEKYGAYNAANLDGGGSSSIVVEGEILSVAGGFGYTGERYIANAFMIK